MCRARVLVSPRRRGGLKKALLVTLEKGVNDSKNAQTR